MSDANLQVGIDAGGAVAGSRTVVRSLDDIYSSATILDTKLRGLESTLGRVGANPGLTQAKAAMQQLQSPLQSIKLELEKIESRIVRIGATALALGAVHVVFGKIREAILGTVKAVDDFQIAVISIAASLTQIRIQNGETDIAGAYEKSSRYAGVLALKLQEIDKNSFANYKGLMAMLQVMTAQGQVLDVNNKKQVEAFTNLSNAIAIMTPGQDQQMQMYQETRALMSGIADRHSQVARMIDQQIKAQGIYKGGLKEVAALGRQHGDTMERLAPYLQGVGAASKDISKTWSTVVATFETALNFIQRAAFGPIVADLTTIVSLFSKLMTTNTGAISDAMQRSWGFIKDAVFDIDEKTKELKFSPEFLNTLKTASQLALAIIDSFALLVKWTIKYSEELKILIATYITYKAVLIATATVNRSLLSLNETNTAAIVRRDVALAKLGITESSELTIKQANLVLQKESLMMAAQEMAIKTTQDARRIAEIAAINATAQAKIYDAEIAVKGIQIRREDLMLEQTTNMEKIKTLGLLREEAVANVALLEGKVALAIAKKQEKVTTIELMLAQQAQLTSQIANGTASKMVMDQLLISETEIAAAKRSSSALSGVVTRTENQLTAARIALTNATNAHNAAVNLGAKTGFQLLALKEAELAADRQLLAARIRAIEVDSAATAAAVRYNAALLAQGQTVGFATTESMAKVQTDYLRLVEQDRLTGSTLAATLVENAHTEAIVMDTAAKNANSIANQVLTASTNLLKGALALVGGPIGALIIAIGALTYAWVKLTEAEEVNRSKKIKAIFESDLSVAQRELDDVNKKLAEAEKARAKKTDPVKASADEEQERLNKLMITETRLRTELAKATENLNTARVGGSVKAMKEAEERVFLAKREVDYFRKVSDETDKAKKKLEEYHKEDMKGYKGLDKPLDDDKKAKKSEAQQAFESLIALQDTYQESALRSGKATDELGAKLATLDQQLANDLEQRKEAFKFDPKAAQQAKEYLTAQIEIMKQNAIIADTKKGQEAYDKAAEAASLQEYKSNLDSRKASLQRHLEDKEISQQQYYKFMGDLIIEESTREIAEQQKVVDAKKAALSEMQQSKASEGAMLEGLAELNAAESALNKVRQDASKRYENNLRAQIKLLEEQRKATLALQSKTVVDAAQLAVTNEQTRIGSGNNSLELIEARSKAELAAIKAKYDLERDELTSKLKAITDATNQQLNSMKIVHDQQMIFIDSENKQRIAGITNKDERLAEDKRYAEAKLVIEQEVVDKSSALQKTASDQTKAYTEALVDALALINEKQETEELSSKEKTEEEKTKLAKETWTEILGIAKKAVPQLAMFDKLIATNFEKYETVKAGSTKLSFKGMMDMTSAYASGASEMFEGLAATQDTTSREGFENAKALNLASAVMNTAAGITKALAQGGIAGIATGAIVAAAGAIQIAQIASTSFGGGGTAPSAPSGSFASVGSEGGNMGIANLQKPILSVEDTRTAETYEKLIASNQNIVMAIGRLSTALDDLSALFEEGGAGIGLATNAPGQNVTIGELPGAMSKVIGDFKSIFTNFGSNLNPINFLSNSFSAMGDFLFGGKVETIGAGITLAMKEGTVNAWDFIIQKKDGGLLGKDSSWANWVGNNDVGAFMSNLMQPYVAEMANMAKTLGGTLNLAGFDGPTANIMTAGKTPEEIGKELETWTKDTLNAMALMVDGLEENIGAYDNAYERLIALNNALVSTAEAFELIGKSTDNLNSFEAAKWVEALQIKMGGEDEFSDAIETYFSSLFTEEEQAAQKLEVANRKVKNAFIDMGSIFDELAKSTPQEYTTTQTRLSDNTVVNTLTEIPNIFEELIASGGIPKTRDEFKDLVNSLDVTTDSGAAAFAALMNVSESFGLVMTSADETAAKMRKYQDLEVRLLNAQGNTAAAEAMERRLSAERELQDALESGYDATYIARLKEVLALEEQGAVAKAAAAATAKAAEALTNATAAAESSVASITSAFADLTKSQVTADAQTSGAMVGGVRLSGAEYKSYGSFVTFLDQAAGELQKIADMGFPEELQAAVDQITAMVDTASKQLASQVASARILAGDAKGALDALMSVNAPGGTFATAAAYNMSAEKARAEQLNKLYLQASENALEIVDALKVINQLKYSPSSEMIGMTVAELTNGLSQSVKTAITGSVNMLVGAGSQYLPSGPGVAGIYKAQAQAQEDSVKLIANGQSYYGMNEVAFGAGLERMNTMLENGRMSADEYTEALGALERTTGITADTTKEATGAITSYEDEVAAAQSRVMAVQSAGLSSLNHYFTQMTTAARELQQQAVETSTALGKVSQAIGRMKSIADVIGLSVTTAGSLATAEQSAVGAVITAAATDAQKRLTTQTAAKVSSSLSGLSAFAGMDETSLRNMGLLLDGLSAYDSESFEIAFTRINAALVNGAVNVEQYAALYGEAMNIFEGGSGIVDSAINALSASIDAEKAHLQDALDAQLAAIAAQREAATQAYELQREAAQAAIDAISGLASSLHSLLDGLQDPLADTLLSRQAAQRQLTDILASGTLPTDGSFDAAMKTLAQPSEALFGSWEEYATDFYKTAIDLTTLSGRADSQLSVAELTLKTLEDSYNAQMAEFDRQEAAAQAWYDAEISRLDALLKTNEQTTAAVLSVDDALRNLQFAQNGGIPGFDLTGIAGLKMQQSPDLSSILPGFAVGTNYVPYDMVANIHQGERIIPAADNYRLMQSNDEIAALLTALITEVRAGNTAIAVNTNKTAKVLDKWNVIGMPAQEAA